MNRRTVLKASAWSVPVVAVATMAPAAAATNGFDLRLLGFAGETLAKFNDDKTRYVEQSYTTGTALATVGTAAAPAGTVVTVSFDNRLIGAVTLHVEDVEVNAATTSPSGTTTTQTFVLTQAVPVAVDELSGLRVRFGPQFVDDWDALPFYEDIAPYTVSVSPASGADPDTSNNGWSAAAVYGDAFDGAVSATWGETVIDVEGNPTVARHPETATLVSRGPGAIPAGARLYFGLPEDGVTAFSVSSVTVDGDAVTDLFGALQPELYGGYHVETTREVAAGSTVVLTLSTTFAASATTYPGTPSVSLTTGPGETDTTNNNVSPA
ncbi:hypothetical protein [Microbacterium sp. No. 7]|uniref:hypothetical protein n=1 Tax=Microbacterium sp. No. 7 TaxID=1714373 RepID=UPI0006D1CF18|nr:hypothetical protein [Microbacterium sp. No. 7]